MLSVSLLGVPRIELDGSPLNINRRKSRAILYYLAAHTEALSRDHLLAFFWPDHPRDTAQQTLRTTLHGLRQAIGSHLVTGGSLVGLDPLVEVDVRLLEAVAGHPAGIDEPTLRGALGLYRGPFLDEFSLDDTIAFETWQEATQEYYRRLVMRGFAILARMAGQRGDIHSAAADLETALGHDPLQEDLQRDLLRLLYQSGNRAEAVRRYDQLVHLLDEELGVPPMPETRALYDSILADRLPKIEGTAPTRLTAPDPHQAASPSGRMGSSWFSQPDRAPALASGWEIPFIGREDELAAIDHAAGQGRFIYLEGEPGIGKTRLVKEWMRRRSQDGQVLAITSGALELETVLPYHPIAGALRELAHSPLWKEFGPALELDPVWWAAVGRLAPELLPAGQRSPTSSSGINETVLWEGIARLFQAVAQQAPLILFIDDLHWADSASLGLLGYLVRKESGPTGITTWLGAAHPPGPGSSLGKLLASLSREDRLIRVNPARMTAREIREIAAQFSDPYTGPLAAWLEHSSEGNPYILSELVRWASENHVLTKDGILNMSALSGSPVVPGSIYDVTAARLARLSSDARQVLDAAVAAGREFDPQVVIQASALSEDAALDGLDELTAAGLIHAHTRTYHFDHSLIMEVAYREAGEPRHRRFHRRVGESLESLHHNDLDAVAGLLASHFSEGLAPERAAPYALSAAHQAEALAAWDEAAGFYHVALEAERKPAGQAHLWMAIAEMKLHRGDHQAAETAARTALQLAESVEQPDLLDQARLALAKTLLAQTRLDETIELARVTLLEAPPACAQTAEYLWGTALSIQGFSLDEAEQHLLRAKTLADDYALSETPMRVEFELGNISAQRGDLPAAVARYRTARELARQSRLSEAHLWQVLSTNNLAYHLHLMGDPSARETALSGLEYAKRNGMLSLQSYLYSTLAEIALADGQVHEAQDYFQEALKTAERHSVAERIAGSTAGLGRVAAARGDTHTARSLFSRALAMSQDLGIHSLAGQIEGWISELE